MKITLLVAMSENHVIGRDQKLPWHLPEDLKRFKKLTWGHPVIMGRKTFESIGKPLPGRENVVVTRSPKFAFPGARIASSIAESLKPYLGVPGEVFFIGGGEIFSQTVDLADSIRLTLVHTQIEGDVYFPEVDWSLFKEVFREEHAKPIPFSFIDYERCPKA